MHASSVEPVPFFRQRETSLAGRGEQGPTVTTRRRGVVEVSFEASLFGWSPQRIVKSLTLR
jgi:hypothetical protein